MTYLSLQKINPRNINIIPKRDYFRLKYTDDITILCLIVYCSCTKISYFNGKIRFIIRDKYAIQSLLDIDKRFKYDLQPYKPILTKEQNEYVIHLHPNNKLLEICGRAPKSIHIHIKSVRRSTHLNTPIIYILE